MFHILRWVVAAIALLGVFGYWFVNQPQMDPLMTPERKARIEASPHYVNGEFVPRRRMRRSILPLASGRNSSSRHRERRYHPTP